MKQLYTEHVLPRDLLELWNNGLGNLSHVIGADRDKDEEKPRMVAKFVRWLTEHLMRVDAKPVLSRFFHIPPVHRGDARDVPLGFLATCVSAAEGEAAGGE